MKAQKIAEEIKEKVDMLVDTHGTEVIDTLKSVRKVPSWNMLDGEDNRVILLSMKMYLDGIIHALHMEKNK